MFFILSIILCQMFFKFCSHSSHVSLIFVPNIHPMVPAQNPTLLGLLRWTTWKGYPNTIFGVSKVWRHFNFLSAKSVRCIPNSVFPTLDALTSLHLHILKYVCVCLFGSECAITLPNHGALYQTMGAPSSAFLKHQKALDETLCMFVISQFSHQWSKSYWI